MEEFGWLVFGERRNKKQPGLRREQSQMNVVYPRIMNKRCIHDFFRCIQQLATWWGEWKMCLWSGLDWFALWLFVLSTGLFQTMVKSQESSFRWQYGHLRCILTTTWHLYSTLTFTFVIDGSWNNITLSPPLPFLSPIFLTTYHSSFFLSCTDCLCIFIYFF